MSSKENKTEMQQGGLNFHLLVSVAGALSGMFFFGYNTGVINSPKSDIENFMKNVSFERYGVEMSTDNSELLISWVVAIFALGGLVGGFGSGWLASTCGRKGGLLLTSGAGVVASLLLGFARLANTYEMLFVGRFLVGASSAMFTSLSPMYISEVAPLRLRGALGVCNQLSVTAGLLVSQLLGADFGLRSWDVLLGLSLVPCVVLIGLLPFCPESPRYLLLSADKEDRAVEALSWLRMSSASEVRAEIQAMKDEEVGAEPAMGVLQLLRSSALRKPLMVAAVLQLSQQLSGINGVLYYSTSVFEKAGLDKSTAKTVTVGTGGIMLIMTLVSAPFMDRVGRRLLMLVGLGGMFVFSLAITATLALVSYDAMRALAVVSVLAFVVLFSLGPGSIPWLITAELFSQGPRSAAVTVATVVNWAANFLVGLLFPIMQSNLDYLVFTPFAGLLFLFTVFTFIKVPETKNKSFREIADSLR